MYDPYAVPSRRTVNASGTEPHGVSCGSVTPLSETRGSRLTSKT